MINCFIHVIYWGLGIVQWWFFKDWDNGIVQWWLYNYFILPWILLFSMPLWWLCRYNTCTFIHLLVSIYPLSMMSLLHTIYRLFYYWAHTQLPMMYYQLGLLGRQFITWWTTISVRCAAAAGSDGCDRGAPSVAFVSCRLPGEARPSLSFVLIPLQSPLCASSRL